MGVAFLAMNHIFCFLGPIGMPELILIFIILLLLFGAKKLPELARGLGKSINEFKKATNEVKDTFEDAVKDEEKKARQQPPVADSKPADEPPAGE